MALFNKNKKKEQKSVQNNSEAQNGDFFDRIFNDADNEKKEMVDYVMKHQPKSISENHKSFISDFDNVLIEQSANIMKNENSFQKTEKIVESADVIGNLNGTVSCIYGLSSVIGCRESQQDAAAVSEPKISSFTDKKWLAVLCDGMGGMEGGEQASALCVTKMLSCFESIGNMDIPQFYRNSISNIDVDVATLKDANGNYLRAGSTLVSVVIDGSNLYWGSVGDSHIYIIRGKEMIRVNAEHNYLMELMAQVRSGEITIEQANNDKNKEALISYMGIGNISLMDVIEKPFKLLPNDFIILCSDGLYRSVTDGEIYNIVVSNCNNMQKAADMLTACALSKNKKYQDNTTVITIRYI